MYVAVAGGEFLESVKNPPKTLMGEMVEENRKDQWMIRKKTSKSLAGILVEENRKPLLEVLAPRGALMRRSR